MNKAISGGRQSQSMVGEEGRRRKVEGEKGGKFGNSGNGEKNWRGGGDFDEQTSRNLNGVSFGLLPNLWLSQLLEKHNQVQVKSNHPLNMFHNTQSESGEKSKYDPKVLRLGGATRIREELER